MHWTCPKVFQEFKKNWTVGATPRKMGFFLRGSVERFTGGWVSCCWVPERDDAGWSENCMPRCNSPKNGHLPERKRWAFYWRVSELLLSPREGGWAVAESQRGMTQDEVKIVCQGATPWKTGIFIRRRVELFTGGWVSCCLVPKRDDAGNEKNDYKTDKENRKGKYKHHVSFNLT